MRGISATGLTSTREKPNKKRLYSVTMILEVPGIVEEGFAIWVVDEKWHCAVSMTRFATVLFSFFYFSNKVALKNSGALVTKKR